MTELTDPLATPTTIAFAGDWHMNAPWAVSMIQNVSYQDVDVIIHAGDFGYTFNTSYLNALEEALDKAGIHLLFVDGNHEDYEQLYSFPVGENGLRELAPHIWHVPRGFRWNWGGVRFMGMGGAHSVDRPWRQQGISWWPEELITFTEIAKAAAEGPVDVLVSHDCPKEVTIPGIDDRAENRYSDFPPEQLQLARAHRQRLSMVTSAVTPTIIVHGHYHRAYAAHEQFEHGGVIVWGLDCDGTSYQQNIRIVDLVDIQAVTGRSPESDQ